MTTKNISPPAIVKGRELYERLGYRSERSFLRAREAKIVAIPLYPTPGQSRGVYALARDVAAFERIHGEFSVNANKKSETSLQKQTGLRPKGGKMTPPD